MTSDESILGLLLRAHAKCAEQSHGEKYVFQNESASGYFGEAVRSIESAIKAVGFAEIYVAKQSERKKT